MTIRIKVLDTIDCEIDHKTNVFLRPALSYSAVYYQQLGPYKKVRKEYQKCIIKSNGKGRYYFNTGLLDRVLKYCKAKGVEVQIVDPIYQSGLFKYSPHIPNSKFTLRSDQLSLIQKIIDKDRGVLVAPTGVGKTVLGIGIVSAMKKTAKVLWLCHTKDLMYQTQKEFKECGFNDVGIMGDGKSEWSKRIVVATRQSFIDIYNDVKVDLFDAVCVDETHHIKKFDSEYAKILSTLVCNVRVGLTATPNIKFEEQLAVESYLGECIGEMTIQEGAELGLLAVPKIKLLKVSKDYKIKELRKYPDVYQRGVVDNEEANRLIVEIAKKHTDKNESVLIFVRVIEHGKNLVKEAEKIGLETEFVFGQTTGEDRSGVKESLKSKETRCVITSVIWREGVNIPSLDVVINAMGGKDEAMTKQTLGRGLRRTKDKAEITYYDIFNPSSNYLIEHFGERMCMYSKEGWI